MTYSSFLDSKTHAGADHGFADALWLPDSMFDFQHDMVEWALRKGRAAVPLLLRGTSMQCTAAMRPGSVTRCSSRMTYA